MNSPDAQKASIDGPTPTRRQRAKWRWLLFAACILGITSAALLYRNREQRLAFTNGSGAFRIESVTVSKATKHADYFPNRNQYLLTRIVPWPKWRPSVPGLRLDGTTSVESTGLWIRWKSRTGALDPVHIKVYSSTTPPPDKDWAADLPLPFVPANALNKPLFREDTNMLGSVRVAANQPFTKSGLFLFILNTNALPNEDIVVRTPEGDATIHFK